MALEPRRQAQLGEPPTEEWENILLDPSLVVSRVKLAKLLGESEALRDQGVAAHYFVPGGFVEMLNRLQEDAVNTRCWRYFAGSAATSEPNVILSALGRMRISPFEFPSQRPQELSNFDAARGLSGTFRDDEYLTSIINQEAAFLAAHSMILARVQKVFDALVKGGIVGIEGLESFVSRQVIDRLKKYGWRRLCKNVAIPLTGVWVTLLLPVPWPQMVGTVVVIVRLDP